MKKRVLALLTVVSVMAALMMVSALPVFGAANRHASCVGAGHSRQTEPGVAGVLHSARKGENGDSQSFFARFVPGGGQGGHDRNTLGSEVNPTGQECGPD
jgi:hypothetical protein